MTGPTATTGRESPAWAAWTGYPFPGLTPIDGPALLARLRLSAVLLGYFVAGVAALVLFVVTTVALATSPLGLGVVLLLGLVPIVARLTGEHRRVTGGITGRSLATRYAEADRPGPFARLHAWVRDKTRWRDYSLLAFSGTGGLVMAGLPLTLLAAPIAHLVLAYVEGGAMWLLLLISGPALVLWWILTPILLEARLKAERYILGDSDSDARVAAAEGRAEVARAARAETIDHSAAELRRIERDLHDGAQARLVSLGMNLGLAAELMERDPDTAAELLAEARTTTLSALADLRSVVHGMHPPVLADRGLAGAVEALALDLAVPVTVSSRLTGRAPAPVESAVYFAVSECLANTVKHSGAARAWVVLGHRDGMLSVMVGDDGRGGADPTAGSGLAGVVRRIATFEGHTEIDSPPGGPTIVRMEVPCLLASP